MRKFKIAVTDPLTDDVINYLKSKEDLEVELMYGVEHHILQMRVREFDGLLIRSRTKITDWIIQDGISGNLKVVGTATAGVDHINLSSAKTHRITVVNSPWGNSLANAEYIIGMMIALSRNFIPYHNKMKRGIWNQEYGIGPEIAGKNFCTIGFGRIGSLAAEKARALGMNVFANDPFQNQSRMESKLVKHLPLEELLPLADFLSISVPYYSKTINLLREKELSLLKKSCYVIQSSRGGVIDELALIKALQQKKIAGACIDVFEHEPNFDKDFTKLPNVILTPHIGCSSKESRIRSGMIVAEDVLRVLNKQEPINAVGPVSAENFHKLLG